MESERKLDEANMAITGLRDRMSKEMVWVMELGISKKSSHSFTSTSKLTRPPL
jgi:hypothetical protein